MKRVRVKSKFVVKCVHGKRMNVTMRVHGVLGMALKRVLGGRRIVMTRVVGV